MRRTTNFDDKSGPMIEDERDLEAALSYSQTEKVKRLINKGNVPIDDVLWRMKKLPDKSLTKTVLDLGASIYDYKNRDWHDFLIEPLEAILEKRVELSQCGQKPSNDQEIIDTALTDLCSSSHYCSGEDEQDVLLAKARILLEHGANPNANGSSVLDMCSAFYPELFELLLANGAKVAETAEETKNKFFDWMASYTPQRILQHMLEKNLVSVNATYFDASKNKNISVLHAAAVRNHVEIVKYCLDRGVETDEVPELAFETSSNTIKLFLDRGLLSVDAIEPNTNQPITLIRYTAAYMENWPFVNFLIKEGADCTSLDNNVTRLGRRLNENFIRHLDKESTTILLATLPECYLRNHINDSCQAHRKNSRYKQVKPLHNLNNEQIEKLRELNDLVTTQFIPDPQSGFTSQQLAKKLVREFVLNPNVARDVLSYLQVKDGIFTEDLADKSFSFFLNPEGTDRKNLSERETVQVIKILKQLFRVPEKEHTEEKGEHTAPNTTTTIRDPELGNNERGSSILKLLRNTLACRGSQADVFDPAASTPNKSGGR